MNRKAPSKFALLCLALFVLSACGANAEPVLPTLRPTLTTIPTLTPTLTPLASATLTPSPPTPIALAPTAGPSPTPLIGATPVRVQPLAATPSRQVTQQGSLGIEYFTTDVQAIRPGDNVTLLWSIKGADGAIIYRLTPTGTRGQLWQVGRSGKLQVPTRAADQDTARFTISVGDAFGRVEQTLSISLSCPQQSWFFEPAPASCPADAPLYSQAVQQTFERGQMIWISTQGRIYVLYNDAKKPAWEAYADTFKDGQPDHDVSLSAPPNLIQPIRGFGLVWRSQPHVRDRLGWANGPELAFDGAYQSDNVALPDTTLYVRARDKVILQLTAKGAAWKLVTATQ